jgi:phage shock protein C
MEQTTGPTTRTTDGGADAPPVSPFADTTALPPSAAAQEPERPRFRLHRSRTDRMLGGVCGGLAESLDVDPALLRIGLVALTVLGAGAGVVLYAAVWLLAPEDDGTR